MTLNYSAGNATSSAGDDAGYAISDPGFHAPAGVNGGIVERLLLEDAARELARQIDAIGTRARWTIWRKNHHRVLAAVYRLLPDCPAKRALSLAGRAAKVCFERYPKREVA